ncbi:MAG: hypothetical protein IJN50_04820 [Clostridia bacterium]|nr:hypothetical protein [Clostridia bacterium]
MNVEAFLDYNEILKIVFEISEDKIDYNIICEYGDERLRNRIINNLKSICTFEQTENPDIYRLSISDTIYINIKKSTGEIESINKLTAFETRTLAQKKDEVTIFDRQETDFVPKTDLHTHFAGALSPDILIDVAKNHNVTYPAKFLQEIGIDISKYEKNEKGEILISSIVEEDINILKERLAIPMTTQETFNKMEEIYKLRGPFTKNQALFADYLKALAADYKEKGIEYAELSFSAFVGEDKYNSEYMQIMEDVLPEIEKETGVRLRFLAGIWRHSDKEWNLDDVDRIKTIAKSPYIVGCDFMGHETNETKDFTEELEMLAEYAMLEDPEFTIRVHAGENPIFKKNVYQTLKIMHDKHARMEEKLGKKLPMPKVRIGHGLYGLDGIEDEQWNPVPPEEILGLLKEMGAIVEFNMSSNLALNNINSISEIPIKRYLDAGVKVTLSTDGHGLYSTAGIQEVILALAAGLKKEDLEKISQSEKDVMEGEKRREETHEPIKDVRALYDGITYSTENGEKRYTKEVEERIRFAKEKAYEDLTDAISNKAGAVTDKEEIEKAIKGKTPIMLTGASKSAWPKVSEQDQQYISILTQVLADTLNPNSTYIMTGGTNFGVEKTMHEAVYRSNKKREEKMVLLGTFTMEAEQDLPSIEPNTITHATILQLEGRNANNWMDLPETQLVHTQKNGGHVIGIAGGAVVSDIIQRGYNLDMDMHLMDGPKGASTDKSRSLAGNDYSFKTIEELLQRLYSRNPNLFGPEFSLDKSEIYIENAKGEIEKAREKPNNISEVQEIPELTEVREVTPKEIADTSKKITAGELQPFKNGFGKWIENIRKKIQEIFINK